MKDKNYISSKEVCKKLNINIQTLNNWIKLGKIKSEKYKARNYFEKAEINRIIDSINSGTIDSLKSRRNKAFKTGNLGYLNYVENYKGLDYVIKISQIYNKKKFNEDIAMSIVVEYSIKFILNCKNKFYIAANSYILEYLEGSFDLGFYSIIVDSMILNCNKVYLDKIYNDVINSGILKYDLLYSKNCDVLGLLYISLRDFGWRKSKGAYYTPSKIVKRMTKISFDSTRLKKSVIDICCGSGNFLIDLALKGIECKNMYGMDIDENAVNICRINLAFIYGEENIPTIIKNITCASTLFTKIPNVDLIIGNPPWISNFQLPDGLSSGYYVCKKRKCSLHDLFLEYSIRNIEVGTTICFVLPESILKTKIHERILEFLLKNTKILKIVYLGQVFYNVDCPSIILKVEKSNFYNSSYSNKCLGIDIETKKEKFKISIPRNFEYNSVNLRSNDIVFSAISSIDSMCKKVLLGKISQIKMGIVTGGNRYALKNDFSNGEDILVGTDVQRYSIKDASKYIDFIPSKFQQSAPEIHYRKAPKLVYRFISDKLIFACDTKGRLTLNSCNFLYITDDSFDVYYILGILNSTLMSFYFKNKYFSNKVLKRHLESIPIPIDKNSSYNNILKLSKNLSENHGDLSENVRTQIYNEIDRNVFELYNLDSKKYKNLFK